MVTSVSKLTSTEQCLVHAERHAFRQAVRVGGLNYIRSRDLHRIVALRSGWAEDQDSSLVVRQIRDALLKVLRAMVRARRQGTWHYSPSRHLAILQALAGEIRLAREEEASYPATAPPRTVDGSMAPVARPSATETPLGSA